jgi:hypothetical protein
MTFVSLGGAEGVFALVVARMLRAVFGQAFLELLELVVAFWIVAIFTIDARLRVRVADVVEIVEAQEVRVVLRLAFGVGHPVLDVLALVLAVGRVDPIPRTIRFLDLLAHQPAIGATAE